MQYLGSGLWITDIDTVAERPLPNKVETVVSVCQDACVENVSSDVAYEHVRLADDEQSARRWGGSCNYVTFEKAADVAYEALVDGDVVVHCHHGKNRSVAVCAAVLAREQDTDFDTALDHVLHCRREYSDVTPNPTELLRSYGHRYVYEHQ